MLTPFLIARLLASREAYQRGVTIRTVEGCWDLIEEMMPTARVIYETEDMSLTLDELSRRIEYPYLTHPTDMALYI